MFYPVPYEYHDLVVDRRNPRPERLVDTAVPRHRGSLRGRLIGR